MTLIDDRTEEVLAALQAYRQEVEAEGDRALAAYRERIEGIDRAVANIRGGGSTNGAGPAKSASPPRKRTRRAERRPAKDSTSPASTPATPERDAGADARARGERNREAILKVIREKPGASTTDVVEVTGLDRSTVTTHLTKLVRSTQGSGRPAIRMEKDPDDGRVRRYYAQEADLMPANAEGVKTGEEQKIVDCLKSADGPLPPGEVAVRSGIRSDHVPQMLQRLTQREVIERLPPKRDGLPPRYRPASGEGTRTLGAAIADLVDDA